MPSYPVNGFADLSAARAWVLAFVLWYNHVHRHSRIRFVTPAERHAGHDTAILDGPRTRSAGAAKRVQKQLSKRS